jgi:predicted amidophosphoribosyltransferase
MYCENCGTVLQNVDQKYCPNCGKPLRQKIVLDSTKCLLFFDTNNKKVWLWRGNKVDIREKLNAVKAARFKKFKLGSEIKLQTIDEGKETSEFLQFIKQHKTALSKYRKLIRRG